MADYQLIDYFPIDTVFGGKLLTHGDSLIVVYLPTRYQPVASYRIYDISSPHDIEQVAAGVLSINIDRDISYRCDVSNGYGLFPENYKLKILDIADMTSSELVIYGHGGYLYSAQCGNGFLFIGCADGLHIWDISSAGNYHEIYAEQDTIMHWYSKLLLIDTTLFISDYRSYQGYFIKWNVTDPYIPVKLSETKLPDGFYSFNLQDSIFTGFAGADEEIYTTLSRLICRNDSFIQVEYAGYNDFFYDISYVDSLIYAIERKDIVIFSAEDCLIRDSIQSIHSNYGEFVSITTRAGIVYALLRTGIAVYERSTP